MGLDKLKRFFIEKSKSIGKEYGFTWEDKDGKKMLRFSDLFLDVIADDLKNPSIMFDGLIKK